MPLSEGIPIVCHADPKDVVTIASGIQKYSGTILVGTPTFLRMYTISKKVSVESMQSLRLVVAGAEKLRSEVRDGFENKFKMPNSLNEHWMPLLLKMNPIYVRLGLVF